MTTSGGSAVRIWSPHVPFAPSTTGRSASFVFIISQQLPTLKPATVTHLIISQTTLRDLCMDRLALRLKKGGRHKCHIRWQRGRLDCVYMLCVCERVSVAPFSSDRHTRIERSARQARHHRHTGRGPPINCREQGQWAPTRSEMTETLSTVHRERRRCEGNFGHPGRKLGCQRNRSMGRDRAHGSMTEYTTPLSKPFRRGRSNYFVSHGHDLGRKIEGEG